MVRRRASAVILALALVTPVAAAPSNKAVYSDRWETKYDRYFRKYAKRYFGPSFAWHWFKAQGIAESNLDPEAMSRAGARGLMQILPSTYAEIREKNPHFRAIDEPRWNIAAAIYYDRSLYRKWLKRVPSKNDRLMFTFASYNAGYGTISKAHRRASKNGEDASAWNTVAPHSPRETQLYVRRIKNLMTR